jgi:hypothetical protein
MTRSRPMVTCIFCGQRRRGSEEHVIPRWVRERLNITSPVTVTSSSGASTQMAHLAVKLRRMVCEDCNNGWMSGLEDTVKPFLGPMLVNAADRPASLDAIQQRDLARWATMKVLLLEWSMRQQHAQRRQTQGYAPSAAELAWLYAQNDAPPRSRVWLGAFDAQGRITSTTQARNLGSAGPGQVPAHMTMLTVGCVLFQVFSTDYVAAGAQGVAQYDGKPPPPYDQALPRIWPQEHPIVRWPPSLLITPDVLDWVVNWGPAGQPPAGP